MRHFVTRLIGHITPDTVTDELSFKLGSAHVSIGQLFWLDRRDFVISVRTKHQYFTVKLYEDEHDALSKACKQAYNKVVDDFVNEESQIWDLGEEYTDEMGS